MFKNFCRLLIADTDFKTILSLVSSANKSVVYLKCQVNGTNVLMLIDTGASNFHTTSRCATKLKEMTDTVLAMKINFAQESYQAAQVAKGMRFKAGGTKFDMDFTICGLECLDVVLRNTTLEWKLG